MATRATPHEPEADFENVMDKIGGLLGSAYPSDSGGGADAQGQDQFIASITAEIRTMMKDKVPALAPQETAAGQTLSADQTVDVPRTIPPSPARDMHSARSDPSMSTRVHAAVPAGGAASARVHGVQARTAVDSTLSYADTYLAQKRTVGGHLRPPAMKCTALIDRYCQEGRWGGLACQTDMRGDAV